MDLQSAWAAPMDADFVVVSACYISWTQHVYSFEKLTPESVTDAWMKDDIQMKKRYA